jgi:GntR family transcriptional regulator
MLQITFNPGDGTPLYFHLLRQIKHLIATGRLLPGEELPSVRALAQQLVINPNTVVRAYRELETAGLIYTKRGSGTYVADGRVPYSEEERRRILSERVDALIVEARNLGYSRDELLAFLDERDAQLRIDGETGSPFEGTNHGMS